MATLNYQFFSAGTYDWAGSATTDAGYQVYTEFSNWVTSVNSNPSMSGRQIVEVYGPSQATTPGTDFGFLFNMKKSNNSDYFLQNYVSSNYTTWHYGDVHTPSTSNGGYGTVTSPSSIDSPPSAGWGYILSNNSAATEVFVGYSTIDTKEFFLVSVCDGTGSGDYNYALIGKDTNNEWTISVHRSNSWGGASLLSDLSVTEMGSNSNSNTHQLQSNDFITTPLVHRVSNYTLQSVVPVKMFSAFAAEDLGNCSSTSASPGSYILQDDGDAWVAFGGGYNPWVKFTPTP